MEDLPVGNFIHLSMNEHSEKGKMYKKKEGTKKLMIKDFLLPLLSFLA